jgi:hypothetical protein
MNSQRWDLTVDGTVLGLDGTGDQGEMMVDESRAPTLAVRIKELKSRVRVALPSAYQYQPALMSIAGRITAQGP